jgi:hypothetical protein
MATVGALRFDLGANTAQLEVAMKKVKKELRGVVAEGVALGNMISSAITGALSRLNAALGTTLKHADDMGKAAQSIGIPVEELSRLRHAADLSGVSFENLQSAMGRFSRGMMQAASDAQSTAGRAFAAIGVSATDAAGQIRPTTAVMADIAERFRAMPDGAAKTALAMELFGRSGAALIPMLNQGRDGLNALMREAEELGIVIDSRTAQAAERFNDNLSRIKAASNGLMLQITANLMPALELLAEKMLGFARNGESVKQVADAVNAVFGFLAKNVASLAVFFQRLGAELAAIGAAFQAGMPWTQAFRDVIAQSTRDTQAAIAALRLFHQEIDAATGSWRAYVEFAPTVPTANAPIIASTRSIADAMRAARDEARYMLDEIVNRPTEAFTTKMAAISQALAAGTINWRTYGQMVRRVEEENRKNISSTASLLASTLTTVFGKSKAAGIAAAIINTAVGITNALANLPPPWSWAQAALIAASGAAQIATIKSTNQNGGGGGAPSVHGGSGGGGEGAAAAQPSQMTTINLAPGRYGRDEVVGLLLQMKEVMKDGGPNLVIQQ